jgi:hypothetical protein
VEGEAFRFPGPLDDLLLYWGSVEVDSLSDLKALWYLFFCLVEAVRERSFACASPLRPALRFAG